jgi:hypothetical protein
VGRELVTAAKDIGAERMIIACTHRASTSLAAYAKEKGIEIVTAGVLASYRNGPDRSKDRLSRTEISRGLVPAASIAP